MTSEGGTAECWISVSEYKNPAELENGKASQPSVKHWDCDFYLHQRAFPGTWGAGMQWRLWYFRNMGCGGCQECKNMCRFNCRYCIKKGLDCYIQNTTVFYSSALLATMSSCLQVGKTHFQLFWISLSS